MTKIVTNYAGVDVAKASLEVAGLKPARRSNQPAALQAWLDKLKTTQPGVHLVCQATGRYHHGLQAACAQTGVPLSVYQSTACPGLCP